MINILKVNKKLLLRIIFIVFILSLLPLNSLFAQDYTPISVIPPTKNLNIDGNISTYLNSMFTFILGLAAVLAVIQIAIGGLEYMTSNKLGSIQSAKSKMWGAVVGILLLLSTFIILQQINPELLKFKIGPDTSGSTDENSGLTQCQICIQSGGQCNIISGEFTCVPRS